MPTINNPYSPEDPSYYYLLEAFDTSKNPEECVCSLKAQDLELSDHTRNGKFKQPGQRLMDMYLKLARHGFRVEIIYVAPNVNMRRFKK